MRTLTVGECQGRLRHRLIPVLPVRHAACGDVNALFWPHVDRLLSPSTSIPPAWRVPRS